MPYTAAQRTLAACAGESGAKRVNRFWRKVERRGSDDCWHWTAALGAGRYGAFKLASGLTVQAHRLSLLLSVGLPPADQPEAAHVCDNPLCCNPAHLRWASRAENEADKRRVGAGA